MLGRTLVRMGPYFQPRETGQWRSTESGGEQALQRWPSLSQRRQPQHCLCTLRFRPLRARLETRLLFPALICLHSAARHPPQTMKQPCCPQCLCENQRSHDLARYGVNGQPQGIPAPPPKHTQRASEANSFSCIHLFAYTPAHFPL